MSNKTPKIEKNMMHTKEMVRNRKIVFAFLMILVVLGVIRIATSDYETFGNETLSFSVNVMNSILANVVNSILLDWLTPFIIVSLVFFWWLNQRVDLRSPGGLSFVAYSHLVAWPSYVVANVFQVYSLPNNEFFVYASLLFTTISFVSLFMAGVVGVQACQLIHADAQDAPEAIDASDREVDSRKDVDSIG